MGNNKKRVNAVIIKISINIIYDCVYNIYKCEAILSNIMTTIMYAKY